MSQSSKRLHIQQALAQSANATVYFGHLHGVGDFKKNIALKAYHKLAPEAIPDFVQGYRIWGTLSHANIVQILDLGENENLWFVVMEYVDGPSLSEFLLDIQHHKISLTVQVIVHILTEILIALEYAHRRPNIALADQIGIIHGEICADSILLEPNGAIKLIGFNKTNHKQPQSITTDIRAVGKLLEVLRKHLPEESNLPLFSKIIELSTHPDPNRRFQSAQAMLAALTPIREPNLELNLMSFMNQVYPTNSLFDVDQPTFVSRTTQVTLTAAENDEHKKIIGELTQSWPIEINTGSIHNPIPRHERSAQVSQSESPNLLSDIPRSKTTSFSKEDLGIIGLFMMLLVVALFTGFFLGERAASSHKHKVKATFSDLSFAESTIQLMPREQNTVIAQSQDDPSLQFKIEFSSNTKTILNLRTNSLKSNQNTNHSE
ncbi:MAG: hypothetical protein CMK59_03145 [Proteobacteria bacterium]|nr:hypothetical protein [Pseudomonadota bacterium]